MVYTLSILPDVLASIEQQVQYLLKQEEAPPDRVQSWVNGLLQAIRAIPDAPRRYPAHVGSSVPGDIRRMAYGNYMTYFRVDDARSVIEVLAFQHAQQRPVLGPRER